MRSLIQIKNIPGNAAGTAPQLHWQQVAQLGRCYDGQAMLGG